MTRMRSTIGSICVATLVACGGGGGSDVSSSTSNASTVTATSSTTYRLAFEPGTLTTTGTAGSVLPLAVKVTTDRAIEGPFDVAVVDTAGIFQPTLRLTPSATRGYDAVLSTAPGLPAGRYRGTLQVLLCRDTASTCGSPLPGSPWTVPYDVEVTAAPLAGSPSTPTATPPATPPSAPPSPPPPEVSPLRFAIEKLTVDGYAGEIAPQKVGATVAATASTAFAQLVLPTTHFAPTSSLVTDGTTYTATLVLGESLAPGTYSGAFQIRLCRDRACTAQWPGSPASLPYEFTVRPATRLTPLQRLPGVGEWSQHQADAKHTGFVPVTLDPARFNRRWRWVLPDGGTAPSLRPVVTDGGTVFAMGTEWGLPHRLYALSEHDRSVRWVKDFGPQVDSTPPATSPGRVIVATGSGSDSTVWSFDGSTGMQRFSEPFTPSYDGSATPTIANGFLYSNARDAQNPFAADLLTGTIRWYANLPQWTFMSLPAVNGNRAFVMQSAGLTALDAVTGAAAFTIPDTASPSPTGGIDGTPMVDDAGNVIGITGPLIASNGNRLLAYDVANRSVKWSVAGAFRYSPAVAEGVVYAVNGARLEARSQADGTRLWSWTPDEPTTEPFSLFTTAPVPNLVVTRNMVFVSSATRVYGIDLATRTVRWTYPEPGRLAMSPNGILYVVTPLNRNGSAVVAINLQ